MNFYIDLQYLVFSARIACLLQAVAGYDLRFLDIFTGFPGRAHDANVFRHNPLYRHLPERLRTRPMGRLVETYHIVGDSAFPLSPQVLTPYKKPVNGDLNVVQKKYNKHLSSKRNVSEQTFIKNNIKLNAKK